MWPEFILSQKHVIRTVPRVQILLLELRPAIAPPLHIWLVSWDLYVESSAPSFELLSWIHSIIGIDGGSIWAPWGFAYTYMNIFPFSIRKAALSATTDNQNKGIDLYDMKLQDETKVTLWMYEAAVRKVYNNYDG